MAFDNLVVITHRSVGRGFGDRKDTAQLGEWTKGDEVTFGISSERHRRSRQEKSRSNDGTDADRNWRRQKINDCACPVKSGLTTNRGKLSVLNCHRRVEIRVRGVKPPLNVRDLIWGKTGVSLRNRQEWGADRNARGSGAGSVA